MQEEGDLLVPDNVMEEAISFIYAGGPTAIRDLLGYLSLIELQEFLKDNQLIKLSPNEVLKFPNLED